MYCIVRMVYRGIEDFHYDPSKKEYLCNWSWLMRRMSVPLKQLKRLLILYGNIVDWLWLSTYALICDIIKFYSFLGYRIFFLDCTTKHGNDWWQREAQNDFYLLCIAFHLQLLQDELYLLFTFELIVFLSMSGITFRNLFYLSLVMLLIVYFL